MNKTETMAEDTEDKAATYGLGSSSDVKIPEEFQKKVAEMLKGATKEQVDYVMDYCQNINGESDNDEGMEFSTENMPKD